MYRHTSSIPAGLLPPEAGPCSTVVSPVIRKRDAASEPHVVCLLLTSSNRKKLIFVNVEYFGSSSKSPDDSSVLLVSSFSSPRVSAAVRTAITSSVARVFGVRRYLLSAAEVTWNRLGFLPSRIRLNFAHEASTASSSARAARTVNIDAGSRSTPREAARVGLKKAASRASPISPHKDSVATTLATLLRSLFSDLITMLRPLITHSSLRTRTPTETTCVDGSHSTTSGKPPQHSNGSAAPTSLTLFTSPPDRGTKELNSSTILETSKHLLCLSHAFADKVCLVPRPVLYINRQFDSHPSPSPTS
mmetsp:Transcript_14506/g.58816  ORF Transcript_14506/g.58816 Transcript_14506/m.58816 type:complete len:304 (+) Transcript_14506:4665-5576(+)